MYVFWIADCDSFALSFALIWFNEFMSMGKGVHAYFMMVHEMRSNEGWGMGRCLQEKRDDSILMNLSLITKCLFGSGSIDLWRVKVDVLWLMSICIHKEKGGE